MSLRWLGLVPALLLITSGGVRAEDKAVKLDGKWKVTKAEAGDEKEKPPPEEIEKMRMEFKDGKLFMLEDGEKKNEATYKTDEKQTPMQIDITSKNGRLTKAIFKLEKNTLTVCFITKKDADRPTEFKVEKGSRALMLVLERVKE